MILGKEDEASDWLVKFEQERTAAKKRLGAIVKEGETVTVLSGELRRISRSLAMLTREGQSMVS